MNLGHIVAASDESDAGRQAVRSALELGSGMGAQVTVVRVDGRAAAPLLAGVRAGSESPVTLDVQPAGERLRRWLVADVLQPEEMGRVQLRTASGVPGIEICRVADELGADLIVLGRKRHSPAARLLLGDTADAVARRSRVPCLFVPARTGELRTLLVALDGSDRGMAVLRGACDFAQHTGAGIQVVTVERRSAGEPLALASSLPATRSSTLQARVLAVFRREGLPELSVSIRRGDIVPAVLAEMEETGADVLVIGYHRGGPPGVLEAGSTARRLAHLSPSAVLTIPL